MDSGDELNVGGVGLCGYALVFLGIDCKRLLRGHEVNVIKKRTLIFARCVQKRGWFTVG